MYETALEGVVSEIVHSWRHGREIMTPEVKRSESDERLVLTYRYLVTPKSGGDDGEN